MTMKFTVKCLALFFYLFDAFKYENFSITYDLKYGDFFLRKMVIVLFIMIAELFY